MSRTEPRQDKPDELGRKPCLGCGEMMLWPVYAPNGYCTGCQTIIAIDRHMGLQYYQFLEDYSSQVGDPPGGHARLLPKTGIPHLDVHQMRIVDFAKKKFGELPSYFDEKPHPPKYLFDEIGDKKTS